MKIHYIRYANEEKTLAEAITDTTIISFVLPPEPEFLNDEINTWLANNEIQEYSDDEPILTLDSKVNLARYSMQQHILGQVIEESLAELLNKPVGEIQAVFDSKIREVMANADEVKPPTLHISINRENEYGWDGTVTSDNGAVITDYEIVDVIEEFEIKGSTPISMNGRINMLNRNPPFSGPKIEWNFAIAKDGLLLFGTDFTLPLDEENVVAIIPVI